MGTTVLLEHVLSPALAHELMFSREGRLGRDFEGKSCINYVLPKDEFLPKGFDLAARIAEKPRYALVALKCALSSSRRQAFEAARTSESLMHTISFAQPNATELVAGAFAGGQPTKE